MAEVAVIAESTESRLASYLESELPWFIGPLELQKFDGGQSNPTFRVNAASGAYVLRRKPEGRVLPSAHAVDREYRVLRALAGSGVPVSEALHLCTDDSVIGSMFYLMEYVEGRVLWNPSIPEMTDRDRAALYKDQISTLATLHNINVDEIGLGDFGPRSGYYARQITRWTSQYRKAETDPVPAMETLISWLPKSLPSEPERPSLIHGDYRLDNLMVHADKPEILAVLDWELATLGDPVADLAYLCMCLRLPKIASLHGLAGIDRRSLGIPSEAEIVEQYCDIRQIDRIQNWNFYLAFAYFRLASIAQGVFRRALEGSASDDAALGYGNVCPILADAGAALIEEVSQ